MIKKALPHDITGALVPLVPPNTPLAVTNSSSISSSTTLNLNVDTSFIEISAINQGVFLKWGATVSSSSFHEFVQAGFTRHYEVPIDPNTNKPYTSVQFIEQSATATIIVIEK